MRQSRACRTCHARKLRCDASLTGVPCTRCRKSSVESSCELFEKPPPRRGKSARIQSKTLAEHGDSAIQQTQSDEPNERFEYDFQVQLEASQEATDHNNDSAIGNILDEYNRTVAPPIDPRVLDSSQADGPVSQNDAQLRVCQRLATGGALPLIGSETETDHVGREVIVYQNKLNVNTMLNTVLCNYSQQPLTRVIIMEDEDDNYSPNQNKSLINRIKRQVAGLDDSDVQYLLSKKVFDLPPRHVCDQLLSIYLERIHPYAPVLNPYELVIAVEQDNVSFFLLHAILANVVPYAPLDLLAEAGFKERHLAQKSFASKATLLHNFGCEKKQLTLIQGSLILGQLHFSATLDKDYLFWFYNAVRLSIKMGLHKAETARSVDERLIKVCRRIWWVIYARDVLLSVSGLSNVRTIDDRLCTTPPLTLDDWDVHVESGGDKVKTSLQSQVQKLFLIENCKLSTIGAEFLSVHDSIDETTSVSRLVDISEDIRKWRKAISPEILNALNCQPRDGDNVWASLLMAKCYRLECLVLREISNASLDEYSNETRIKTAQDLVSAKFELDAILGRVVANSAVHLYPLSLVICATTVVFLHIEAVLNESTVAAERDMAQLHIQTGMQFLRQAQHNWPSTKWYIRTFDWIISKQDILGVDPARTQQPLSGVGPGFRSRQYSIEPLNGSDTSFPNFLDEIPLWGGLGSLNDSWSF